MAHRRMVVARRSIVEGDQATEGFVGLTSSSGGDSGCRVERGCCCCGLSEVVGDSAMGNQGKGRAWPQWGRVCCRAEVCMASEGRGYRGWCIAIKEGVMRKGGAARLQLFQLDVEVEVWLHLT